MDYLEERKLNLRDMNLEHVQGEIYKFKDIEIDMANCGRTQLQMYRHIAEELAKRVSPYYDSDLYHAQSNLEIMTQLYSRLEEIAKQIVELSDEHDVQMKTPICYFKKFEELRGLVGKENESGTSVIIN